MTSTSSVSHRHLTTASPVLAHVGPLRPPLPHSLRAAGGFAGVGAMFVGAYLAGISVPCPFLHFTGLQCPLCGSTRAAASLLRGDLHAAWDYNALLLVGIVVLGAFLTLELVNWLALWRHGRRLVAVPKVSQDRIYVVVGVIAVVFAVVRNLF